jgi:hypothetical protein
MGKEEKYLDSFLIEGWWRDEDRECVNELSDFWWYRGMGSECERMYLF